MILVAVVCMFKYKPGYRSCDLLKIWVLLLVETLFFQKKTLQDLLSSLNAVISTNESTWIYKESCDF